MNSKIGVALFALSLSTGCTQPNAPAGVGEMASSIIGGTTDPNDNAVVAVDSVDSQGEALCTGELISPHVVLTAAHCAGGEDPTQDATTKWRIYVGADLNTAQASDLQPAQAAHYDPQFDTNNVQNGHDIGVIILQNPITNVTPLAINRTPLEQLPNGGVGLAVRFVGYGLNNGPNQTGAGTKRAVNSAIQSVSALTIGFSNTTTGTCNGDSGGPAFAQVNGQNVIVGLTSYGDQNCQQEGVDTRVDALTTFADQYVKMFDPQTTPSASPSTTATAAPTATSSAPTVTPATVSATTTAGSSTTGKSAGQACTQNSDCSSNSCGLSNQGSLICLAANGAASSPAFGCSVGGSARTPTAPGQVLFGLLSALLGLFAVRRNLVPATVRRRKGSADSRRG